MSSALADLDRMIEEVKREVEACRRRLEELTERRRRLLALSECCPSCDGTGKERYTDAAGSGDWRECRTCAGMGRIGTLRCTRCDRFIGTEMVYLRRTWGGRPEEGRCPWCGSTLEIAEGAERKELFELLREVATTRDGLLPACRRFLSSSPRKLQLVARELYRRMRDCETDLSQPITVIAYPLGAGVLVGTLAAVCADHTKEMSFFSLPPGKGKTWGYVPEKGSNTVIVTDAVVEIQPVKRMVEMVVGCGLRVFRVFALAALTKEEEVEGVKLDAICRVE